MDMEAMQQEGSTGRGRLVKAAAQALRALDYHAENRSWGDLHPEEREAYMWEALEAVRRMQQKRRTGELLN